MSRRFKGFSLVAGAVGLLLICGLVAGIKAANSPQKPQGPLRASEVVALVSGNALPENIVAAINADGLAFHPDDTYVALLKTAGADTRVIDAVQSAKITGDKTAEQES